MQPIFRHMVLGLAGWLAATAAQGGMLELRLDNPPATGVVVALLFDTPDSFADLRDPLRTLSWNPSQAPSAQFEALPAGRYAVLVFHDINKNGELDLNFIGIPREPLGFSRRYWGKGAPIFADAALAVEEGERYPVDMELKAIFQRKGLIGVGLGVLARSKPYRGADSIRIQAIPALTYIGPRVQWLGPVAQVGVLGATRLRLAATARYRLGAYRESDSDFLEGMGNRKDTLFAGVALQASLPAGLRLSAGYEHDVLDRVGGGEGRLGLRRGFQLGRFSWVPSLVVNAILPELARHEYGVRTSEAREGRPAYRPDTAITIEPGLGVTSEWFGAWRILLNASVEFLPPELRDSPLIEKSEVVRFFGAVNYTF